MTTSIDRPIVFSGDGAHRIIVAEEKFHDVASDFDGSESIQIADINGADFDTTRDADTFIVDSRNSAKKDDDGAQCVLARLHLRNVKLQSAHSGTYRYQGWLTSAYAYDSYETDPIEELYGDHKYMPPRYAGLAGKLPMLVNIIVFGKTAEES